MRLLRISILAAIAAGLAATGAWAHTMKIDATALSNTEFFIQDITAPVTLFPVLDGTVVQTLMLDEGNYIFQPGSGNVMPCTLMVTSTGTWDYDMACDPFLAGRGSDELEVLGYSLTIDATALSSTGIFVNGLFSNVIHDGTMPIGLTLVPSPCYLLQPGSGVLATFCLGVDRDGHWGYDAAFDPILSGRGTGTLTILGRTIRIDARPLTATQFVLTNLFGLSFPHLDATVVHALTLLPVGRNYLFQTGSGSQGIANFRWGIDPNGNIDYDPAFEPYLSGRGTDTLVVDGYAVEIDARALGPGSFQLLSLLGVGALDQSSVQMLTLVPTPFYEFFSPPIRFPFTLLDAGTFDYDPLLDFCVTGRGTSRLTILCDPASPPTPEDLIDDLKTAIGMLPPSAFRNGNVNLAKALINKLDAVLAQIEAARAEGDPDTQDHLFMDALDKLRHDILAKTDGCGMTAMPDANDWIVDCLVQADLSFDINRIIMAVSALI